jgi:hypothetical protein
MDKSSYLDKNTWITKTWGSLSLDVLQPLPKEWGKGCNKKMWFNCSCGKSVELVFKRLYSGNQKSCGHCTSKSKEYWLNQKWGNIKLFKDQIFPNFFPPSTKKNFLFACDCGNVESICFKWVNNGQKTCGHCNDKSKEYWLNQKWGELTLDKQQLFPDRWNAFTCKKYYFMCSCNRKVFIKFMSVYNGNSKTCGHCNDKSKEYWLNQKWGTLMLDENQPLRSEWGENASSKLNFKCDCGNSIITRWSDVTRSKGGCKNCGCILIGKTMQSPAGEIYKFVKKISPTAIFGYKLTNTGKEYDIYVPDKKLAIEYHGLIWHSEKYNLKKKKDFLKYKLAQSRNDRLIQIFGDEWETKKDIIKRNIESLLIDRPQKRVKTEFEIIIGKTPISSRNFLKQYHYLGEASGVLTINATYKNQIIGCWVFMKRANKEIIWHRACVNHDFKLWNPHSHALYLAIPILNNLGFDKIVSFSDNRYHSGNLYLQLGFYLDKELNPDYNYTNGVKRYSKYNFRVLAGINEKESAKQKGFYRIWDSGKKRFVMVINENNHIKIKRMH